MARRIRERKLKNPTITIIGEGATERYYFTHLKRLRGYNYVCKPRNFTEQTFDEMRKQIERVLADNGIAVCVFDADVTRTRPAEKAKFEDLKRKYADNPAVILCDSMPSIEFWFLLHYLNTNRYFATSDDVINALHRYMPNFSKHQSFLSKEAWVSELLADNRLDTAIINANLIGIEGESYSQLPKLFQLITV
ncbi:RloB domain-containing protein [Muribaculaceae bacterium Isolate-007 (NCI)]|uniref:RloB family protein n=1 Tax=Muribaculum intestinale TaxID=1796646 RepID=UPI000F4A7480|nr:RloB domain-containing protein [Muribaculaceae bacterium Isolate-100 (HZI)]RXE63656.1 RloB domain-containing protein [Muribaculaceae bacterium Isolate-007 (NCI)]